MTLIMSVSGTRGIVGQTMTPTLAAELGCAFGSHVGHGTIVVGRDSRSSGLMIQAGLTSGLLATGCHVVDLGVVSTPGVGVMVLEHEAAGGVVITASHNPIAWNGIKFLTAQGFAPPPELAEQILQRYRDKAFSLVDTEGIGRRQRDDTTHDRHVRRVLSTLDVPAVRRHPYNVVLDSVNGAGGLEAYRLLERLGCFVHHLNAEPDGRFTHPPEPTEDNLTSLCDAVLDRHADIGFAQDPDADRLAIVDNQGRYIGEEFTIALAAKFMFDRRPGPAAVNLSTSRMIDDLAAQAGGPCVVHRTPVGEANVVQAVLAHDCVIGGEGNGGVIDPRIVPVRDRLVAMGLVLSLLAQELCPLNEIVDRMPRYVMLKRKFELDRPRIDAWLGRVRGIVGDGRLTDSDGLRIDWPDGWVHLRSSNTEPIARVIAEAPDPATAEALVKRVTDLL